MSRLENSLLDSYNKANEMH